MTTEQQAAERGRAARLAGVHIDANPYRQREAWYAWRRGWIAADNERRAAGDVRRELIARRSS